MVNLRLLFIQLVFIISTFYAQAVTGKVIDQDGNGIANLGLQLFIGEDVYTTQSGSDGIFTFENITSVNDDQIPKQYHVSNNFPNPFNPKTRLEIDMPQPGKVKIYLYNIVGQNVGRTIEKNLAAGNTYIDLELNGLPNGVYFANVSIDNNYSITKKMVLMYGSDHLFSNNPSTISSLGKTTFNTSLDSIVITGANINRHVFYNLPPLTGSTIDIGNLSVNVLPAIPTLNLPSNGTQDQPTSLTLSWNAADRAESYEVEVSTDSNFAELFFGQDNITSTNVNVSGLENNTTYYWHVRSINTGGYSEYSIFWSFKTSVSLPSTPTLVSPLDESQDQPTTIELNWSGNGNVTSYNLQLSTDSLFITTEFDENVGNINYYEINNLERSTTYYWRVNAINDFGTSDWSAIWSFSTIGDGMGEPCPGVPTVTYEGKTYNTVQIGEQCWLKENLDVGTMIESNSGGYLQTDNGTVEKYCYDNDPANCDAYGGLYEWPEAMQYSKLEWEKGICPSGWHIPTLREFENLSNIVEEDGNKLKAINEGSGLGSGTNISGFSALISGFRTSSGVFNGRKDRGYFWTSTENSSDNSYNLLLWEDNDQIQFSYNGKNYGFSIRCIKNSENIPEVPSLISPQNGVILNTNSPSLQWSESVGAVNYTLQIASDSSFRNLFLEQSELPGTTIQINALNFNKQYYWRVRALNSYGASSWSEVGSFTVELAKPTLIYPANDATNLSPTPILMWSSVHGAEGYSLQISKQDNFNECIFSFDGLIDTLKQIFILELSVQYYWRVKSVLGNDASDWSEIWTFTVKEDACDGINKLYYEGGPNTDANGNYYTTLLIENQCWLKENINVGSMISTQFTITEPNQKYCYQNILENCDSLGGLYPYPAPICPPGWHIPTNDEFEVLRNAVDGNGNALKALGQGEYDGAGTNTSGFSALLAGRINSDQQSVSIWQYGYFWTSSLFDATKYLYYSLYYHSDVISSGTFASTSALSIRCIKD